MTSPKSVTILAALALLGSAQTALAVGPLKLEKFGGGVTQLTTLKLTGDASLPYLILFAPSEASTYVNPFVTLSIPTTYANVAVLVPGFLGTLSAGGTASASVVIPNDPILLPLTLSFQAVGANPIKVASNLVRITPAVPGTFEATLTSPSLPIAGGAAAPEPGGKLLFAGGSGPVAQSYDPNLEEFAVAGASFGVGLLSQSTALADGRVLFTGGLGTNGQPTNAAAVFDPTTQTTTTLTMLKARAGHGASLLPNGKVLITGGFNVFTLTDLVAFLTGVQGDTEFFDPTTMVFTAGPAMLEPRALHTSTALANGNVLVAGGLSVIPILNIPTVSSTAYEYNSILNSFGIPKFMASGRLGHTATLLKNGKVLVAGGLALDLTQVIATGDITQLVVGTLTDCQVYTPGFLGTFATVNGMSQGRAGAGVIALQDGGALIAGGYTLSLAGGVPSFGLSATADRYASNNTITVTGSMAAPRALPVMTALNDGTILVAGGGPTGAEVYQP